MKNCKNRKSRKLLILCSLALFLASGRALSQTENHSSRQLQLNLQAHGNFAELMYGKSSSICQNLPLSTFTFEGTGSDKIGSTYFFADFEVGNVNVGKNKMLGGTYIEFTRSWNWWQDSKAAGLSIHTEFDAGVGYGGDSWGSTGNGWEFKTALLGGLAYSWFGDDWFLELQMLSRYELKDYYNCGGAGWQFTVVYSYQPVKWFTLSGYADFSQNPITDYASMKDIKSFHFAIEPYLWFNVTDWLSVGSRFRITYNNYQGELKDGTYGYDQKLYFVPTIGLKWNMN